MSRKEFKYLFVTKSLNCEDNVTKTNCPHRYVLVEYQYDYQKGDFSDQTISLGQGFSHKQERVERKGDKFCEISFVENLVESNYN